jgi:hypothetical protein
MGQRRMRVAVLHVISTSLLKKKSAELEKGRNRWEDFRAIENLYLAKPKRIS